MASTPVNIRSATPEDASVIAQFNIAMARETEDKALDEATVRAGALGVIEDASRGFYLIAQDSDSVVGALLVTREWSDWRNGDLWWIQSVYVSPASRRQGVFRALYEAVVCRAKESAVRGIRIYVEHENETAKAVYKSLQMTQTPYQVFERML